MKHFCSASPLACRAGVLAFALAGALLPASAEVTFDFESGAHSTSSIVDGDGFYFTTSTEVARSGSNSFRFVDPAPEPYENFTYDVPFDTFTSGVVSVWFYDARGPFNTGHGVPKIGGSIILEDANNPQDFVALEVSSFPYGANGPAYYATEGTVDRLKPADRFDIANLASRTIGFHKVEFHVSASDTRIYVDGTTSLEVAGPGSSSKLRLRFMMDSPSNNGNALNWITGPRPTSGADISSDWLFFDDISFARELPAAETHTHGFEVVGGEATYDSAGTPGSPGSPGVPPFDNEYMNTFVNQWTVSTSGTTAHSGAQSAYFANATPALKSMTFDLAGVSAGTSATLYFYDALGQNVDFDKNNSIIIENANNPAEFLAIEVNNWPYPYSSSIKNYYLTTGTPTDPASGMLYSGTLPARSIGWHKVEIGFYPTHTLIALDGAVGHKNNPANLAMGPGVDKPLRLRLMADGATQGGFSNWTAVNELTALYHVSSDPYVYYDDISLPVTPASSVNDWQMY